MVGFISGAFIVNAVSISDAPRFQWRGALVDTARHFQPLAAIRAFVDALSYSKMNVLHWHVTDDQSFPYVSTAYPALSAMGAYAAPSTSHTYSPSDVASVVSYALDRGVRVVAEFDTPGHSERCARRRPRGGWRGVGWVGRDLVGQLFELRIQTYPGPLPPPTHPLEQLGPWAAGPPHGVLQFVGSRRDV